MDAVNENVNETLEAERRRLEEETKRLRAEAERQRITVELTRAAGSAGVIPQAVPQVVELLRDRFQVRDGRVVEVDPETDLVLGNVRDAVRRFLDTEGRHFRAVGFYRPVKAAQGVRNPWKPETFNLTEQGRLLREKPELARRLMAEAGVRPR